MIFKSKPVLFCIACVSIFIIGNLSSRMFQFEHSRTSIFSTHENNCILPDSVVMVSQSPNKEWTAEIIKRSSTSNLFLSLTKKSGTRLIVSKDFIVIGYHYPAIDLIWKNNGKVLNIIVDSDFGDNVKNYNFDFDSFSLVFDSVGQGASK